MRGQPCWLLSHLAPCTRINGNLKRKESRRPKIFQKGKRKEKESREWMSRRTNRHTPPQKDPASSEKKKKKIDVCGETGKAKI